MELIPGAAGNHARKSLSGTKIIAFALLLASVLLGGGVLGFMHYSAGQSKAIEAIQAEREATINELEAEGYPVTAESWESRYPPVADEENGALLYEKAFSAIKALPPEQDFLVPYVGKLEPAPPSEGYSTEAMVAMRAHLEVNQEALNLTAQAAAMPRAKFHSYGFVDSGTASMDIVRVLADLLELRIEIAAIDGDLTGLSTAMRTLQCCARALEESTDEFDGVVSLSLRARYFKALEAVLNSSAPSRSLLEEMEAVHWEQSPETVYSNAILRGILKIEQPEIASMSLLVDDRRLLLPFPSAFKEQWVNQHVENYWLRDLCFRQAILRLLDQSADQAGPAYESLESDFEANVSEGLALFRVRMDLRPLWEVRAYEQLHKSALALETFRLETSTNLETLDRLVPDHIPAIPLDPYNGQPIRYVPDGNGYLLYCVGENLVDDGGVEYHKRSEQQEKGDIVFQVRR